MEDTFPPPAKPEKRSSQDSWTNSQRPPAVLWDGIFIAVLGRDPTSGEGPLSCLELTFGKWVWGQSQGTGTFLPITDNFFFLKKGGTAWVVVVHAANPTTQFLCIIGRQGQVEL